MSEIIKQATIEQIKIIDDYTKALANYFLAIEGTNEAEHFRMHIILVASKWTKFHNACGDWSYQSNPIYSLIVAPKLVEQFKILFNKIPDELIKDSEFYKRIDE